MKTLLSCIAYLLVGIFYYIPTSKNAKDTPKDTAREIVFWLPLFIRDIFTLFFAMHRDRP